MCGNFHVARGILYWQHTGNKNNGVRYGIGKVNDKNEVNVHPCGNRQVQ